MGKYINEINGEEFGDSFENKCAGLKRHGATAVDPTDGFVENMICVVDNVSFAAAAYAYNEREYEHFKETERRKAWYILPNASEYAS